jgi:hypothetical protein
MLKNNYFIGLRRYNYILTNEFYSQKIDLKYIFELNFFNLLLMKIQILIFDLCY